MDIFSVISLFGGLAFFLYGMNLMGNGLEKMAGGKLERVLEGLTANRLAAVTLGLGITAIIQSSSATTVMVVGFVNSGIMKLSQAIGVIMGANIGNLSEENSENVTLLLQSIGNFERISDHCSNLAIEIIQYDDGGVNEFAHEIKLKGKQLTNLYSDYSKKYALPKHF
ncbi:MAG: Na/Pi symporter [Eubacteriales bacterium]|nr:Na/Pi symporter [Eubacteriales bacterium]